jgi:hypothetical protein
VILPAAGKFDLLLFANLPSEHSKGNNCGQCGHTYKQQNDITRWVCHWHAHSAMKTDNRNGVRRSRDHNTNYRGKKFHHLQVLQITGLANYEKNLTRRSQGVNTQTKGSWYIPLRKADQARRAQQIGSEGLRPTRTR